MMVRRLLLSVAITVLAFGLSACGARIVPNEVFSSTPGVVVRGEAFEIAEGRPVPLPFVLDPVEIDGELDIVESYDRFRNMGAHDVMVDVPGRGEALYGLLSLHALPEDATGPARRSFSVKVPDSYVAAASDGRISVVYEPVPAGGDHFYGWILWMSDRPF